MWRLDGNRVASVARRLVGSRRPVELGGDRQGIVHDNRHRHIRLQNTAAYALRFYVVVSTEACILTVLTAKECSYERQRSYSMCLFCSRGLTLPVHCQLSGK